MERSTPAGKVNAVSFPELATPLLPADYRAAQRIAAELGLRRLDERRARARTWDVLHL